ncbi:MAG: hypothetical protein II627_04790 [Lachnospiraceae bacterium]|nr:hypothetical protein [Lachnospiraceae bacterium]
MSTADLEKRLGQMEGKVGSVISDIHEAVRQRNYYLSEAESYRSQALDCYNSISYDDDEDGNAAYQAAQRARVLEARAGDCMDRANATQNQINSLKSSLSSYRSEYLQYEKEGEANISACNQAASKLSGVSGSRYGQSGINNALSAVQQRLSYNQKLVAGCRSRIKAIDDAMSY